MAVSVDTVRNIAAPIVSAASSTSKTSPLVVLAVETRCV